MPICEIIIFELSKIYDLNSLFLDSIEFVKTITFLEILLRLIPTIFAFAEMHSPFTLKLSKNCQKLSENIYAFNLSINCIVTIYNFIFF